MQLKLGRLLAGAVLCGLAGAATAQAAPQAAALAKGKRLFMLCASCHDASAGASAKIGPTLHGVVGRAAGSVAGANYSADMKSRSFIWDEAQLNAWLVKPTAVVPGTSMAYLGMPDANERKALIAYLSSLK